MNLGPDPGVRTEDLLTTPYPLPGTMMSCLSGFLSLLTAWLVFTASVSVSDLD